MSLAVNEIMFVRNSARAIHGLECTSEICIPVHASWSLVGISMVALVFSGIWVKNWFVMLSSEGLLDLNLNLGRNVRLD